MIGYSVALRIGLISQRSLSKSTYTAEYKKLIAKMNAYLAVVNPVDLERSNIQAAVLERTTSEH